MPTAIPPVTAPTLAPPASYILGLPLVRRIAAHKVDHFLIAAKSAQATEGHSLSAQHQSAAAGRWWFFRNVVQASAGVSVLGVLGTGIGSWLAVDTNPDPSLPLYITALFMSALVPLAVFPPLVGSLGNRYFADPDAVRRLGEQGPMLRGHALIQRQLERVGFVELLVQKSHDTELLNDTLKALVLKEAITHAVIQDLLALINNPGTSDEKKEQLANVILEILWLKKEQPFTLPRFIALACRDEAANHFLRIAATYKVLRVAASQSQPDANTCNLLKELGSKLECNFASLLFDAVHDDEPVDDQATLTPIQGLVQSYLRATNSNDADDFNNLNALKQHFFDEIEKELRSCDEDERQDAAKYLQGLYLRGEQMGNESILELLARLGLCNDRIVGTLLRSTALRDLAPQPQRRYLGIAPLFANKYLAPVLAAILKTELTADYSPETESRQRALMGFAEHAAVDDKVSSEAQRVLLDYLERTLAELEIFLQGLARKERFSMSEKLVLGNLSVITRLVAALDKINHAGVVGMDFGSLLSAIQTLTDRSAADCPDRAKDTDRDRILQPLRELGARLNAL